MDGTLVDSEPMHWEAWRDTLLNRGVASFPFDEFVEYVGTSNEKLAGDYIVSDRLDCSVEELVIEKQKIYMGLIPRLEAMPGVGTVLERFHGHLRLAIASSSHRVELEAILESLGYGEHFETVVGGDMVSQKKPHPEIYQTTSSLLYLQPGECVAFEDSEAGVYAARNAGMKAVAIPNALSINHDFGPADLILQRIDQFDRAMLRDLSEKEI
jgi:HAD superfamily hydrolase (TIGR01509 family)